MKSDRYSTSPASTTSDMRTAARQYDSTLRPLTHLSDLSRANVRLTTTASYAFLRSTTVASYPSGSKFVQGSKVDLSGIDPAALTADTSRIILLSVKKSR